MPESRPLFPYSILAKFLVNSRRQEGVASYFTHSLDLLVLNGLGPSKVEIYFLHLWSDISLKRQ